MELLANDVILYINVKFRVKFWLAAGGEREEGGR